MASRAGRSTLYAPRGAVATSQPLASSAALDVLRRGGNAVDAAVTAAAVLSVVEPHMTGLGGDLFALVWAPSEDALVGLDASGRSGSLMSPEALGRAESVPESGAAPVTVPGTLSGWTALLDRFGTMSLSEILREPIRLAREGFPVSPIIAAQWGTQVEKLAADPGAAATYLVDGVRTPSPGEWFHNPGLARTLEALAADGASLLYGGDLGRRIVRHLQSVGGFLTEADFEEHRVRWPEPIGVSFRGLQIWELPPAGQGIATLQMLSLLEPFELARLEHNSAEYLHLLIEAKKLAFADLHRHVADPEHMQETAAALLDPSYLARRRETIDPRRAAERVQPGAPHTESNTVYLATADQDGMMVSLINSIYRHFGSGVVVPDTGFALQNRGACFTLEEGHPNRVGPRKRPLHTIIPGFATRGGRPELAFGVMGGSMQPQGQTQLLLNLYEFGLDLQSAVDADRFRHDHGLEVAFEGGDPDVRRGLEALGHHLLDGAVETGGAQAVLRLDRGWAAGSDPRKDGAASGY